MFKKHLQKLIKFFGGELISKDELKQYKSHLCNSINYLTDIEKKNHEEKGLSCVVFSKDRAMQLYSLIDTYKNLVRNPVDLKVIYNSSSSDHELAYLELSKITNNLPFKVHFIKEKKSFRETLINVLSNIKTKNLFFLTDDDIFINNLDFNILSSIDPKNEILSLRHNPKISYSYTANRHFKPPRFKVHQSIDTLNEFNWFDSGYEWSDPWSVNGQIYLTAEILVISKIATFQFPNSYENALKFFNFLMIDKKGLCYDESVVMNIPMNIVQSEYKNLHGNISTENLLEKWRQGYKLDVDILKNSKLNSTHVDTKVQFKKRY